MSAPENDSLTALALREARVISIGALVVCAGNFIGNGNPGKLRFAASLLIPIVFCLLRAAMVSSPSTERSAVRRGLFLVLIAVALIALLVFEFTIGQIVGLNRISPDAVGLLFVLGVTYVFLYGLAHQFVSTAPLLESDPFTDGSVIAY